MTATAPPSSSAVEQAVERFAAGEPVLVAGREGSGATVALSAARVTERRLGELHGLSGGLVVLGLDAAVAERLDVAELTGATRHPTGLRLASPMDASDRRGGWSLGDRAHTIRVATDPSSTAADLTVPGHVHAGLLDGVSLSAPTAALELAYATSQAGAVLLGPLADRAGRPVSLALAARDERLHALPVAPVEELWWSGAASGQAAQSVCCRLPTRLGDFEIRAAVTSDTGETIVTLVHGDPATRAHAHTSTHTACLLGDTFGSLLCDCRERLQQACDRIRAEGAGAIIYVKPAAVDPFTCPRAGAGA
jgi:3,4-dihydroxy 2-butanone 4-phosphate synthase/GTP cyclohydrolase II